MRDKYPNLFGEHAIAMVTFMWQADLHGVANFVQRCLELYAKAGPVESQTSDRPQVLEGML